MPMMVSIQQVSRPVTQEDIDFMFAQHNDAIGDAAEPPRVLVNPNDPTQIAIVGEVNDLDAVRRRSRGAAAEKLQKERGLTSTQLFYFMGG